MTTEDPTTEVEAAAGLAAHPEQVENQPGNNTTIMLPPGWHTVATDGEKLLDQPRRAIGTVVALTASGFVAAVEQRRLNDVPVPAYVDEDKCELVALLNDDLGIAAGWRDNRVQLGLRATAEWQEWKADSGTWMNQDDFADFIERHVDDIVEPEGAVMLDIAQTFHATTEAKFAQGVKLHSGQRQFTYVEETAATAGANSVAVPEVFEIGLRPFIGGGRYRVRARLRFRLNKGALTLAYDLIRPDDIVRVAFGETVATILAPPDGERERFVRIEGRPAAPRT